MSEPRTVAVWQGHVPLRVHVKGAGPAVMFLHGPWGLQWGPFLDALAQQFTVYAPEHPGTSPGDPEVIQHVDTLWDLVLCYDELLEALGLDALAVVGHSFGAMMACEVAALRSSRIRRLALLDPIGLWRDDAPVINWMLLSPAEMAAHVFVAPDGAAARAMFAVPEDPEEGALARTRLTWAMGATGKFIWPIPDKGLKKRMHRIKAKALIVWGEDDALVSVVYAQEFAARIANARVEIIKDCGHVPQVERLEILKPLVANFLAA
jgi:pimeloyl-ACP methyl ester carboxylesterase